MNLLGNDVPPIGMGCWAIGGPFYSGTQCLSFGDVDDKVSTRTIHAAYDAGIRIFDTASVYGAGHSEKLLGKALKNRPDALIISKLGLLFDEQTKQLLGEDTNGDHVESYIESSLERLQRDCIDVMLLHLNALPIEQAVPIFEKMNKAVKAGKIRAYGWSTDFPASAASMANQNGFIGIEHAMNVFIDVPTIQATVEQHDLVAFIRSPLAMGALTGKYKMETTVAENDIRAMDADWSDYFQDRKVSPKYLRKLDAIKELLQTGGRTLSQGALGWLLAKSPSNLPIPGAKTEAQIRDNAGAIEHGPLPDSTMAEIEVLIEREPEGEPRPR